MECVRPPSKRDGQINQSAELRAASEAGCAEEYIYKYIRYAGPSSGSPFCGQTQSQPILHGRKRERERKASGEQLARFVVANSPDGFFYARDLGARCVCCNQQSQPMHI